MFSHHEVAYLFFAINFQLFSLFGKCYWKLAKHPVTQSISVEKKTCRTVEVILVSTV